MSDNPLLAGNRLPGVTFQLPSQGLFYENGELEQSSTNGEVHVFPMTAYDEILLRTPDLLLNGTAVDAVIRRCVPQVLKPNKLLSKDVDYLMTALRSVSLGNQLEITSSHECNKDKEHTYTIDIGDFQQKAKQIDPTIKNQQYTCTIGNKLVYLRPIIYDNLIEILNSDLENAVNDDQDPQLVANKFHSQMMHQIAGLISKVEVIGNPALGISSIVVSDAEKIVEWLESLELKDLRAINKKIDETSEWGADLKYPIICKECGKQYEATVPLNPNRFFM